VAAQFRSVVDDIGVDAVKIGMLGTAATCELVADLLATLPAGVPVVLDPVAVSKHGDPLIDADAVGAMRSRLFPLATIATPNLDEARALVGPGGVSEVDQARLGHTLLALGASWVLVKGGHAEGDPTDVLVGGDGPDRTFTAARDDNAHTHGTGCTLASAIASRLALGDDVPTAVRAAKAYVTGAIRGGFALGAGIGPTDHLWELRPALGV
jgi:hydroxymethylpyrimidine/phosphomethylpyrimidine kinase